MEACIKVGWRPIKGRKKIVSVLVYGVLKSGRFFFFGKFGPMLFLFPARWAG